MKAVLITGATGFLGTEVTRLVLEQTSHSIIVLVRGKDHADVMLRLERTWREHPDMVKEIGNRIRVLNGDLCLSRFGLNDTVYADLIDSVSHIIHLAADIRLNESLADLRRINVEGVRNVLDLAHAIHSRRGLARLSYVSTAYVAGVRKGAVSEEDLTDRYGFSNPYERSKFEGEFLVREAGTELPVSVFRPGMVVGNSASGAVKTFNTLYFPLRLYLTGKLKFLPVNPDMKINMVPADYVSAAIAELTFDPRAEGLTFHLTLPAGSLPTVREMLLFTRQWASENLHVALPSPVFLPVPLSRLRWLGRFFPGNSPVRSLLFLAPYFEEDRIYLRDHVDRLLGPYRGSWRGFFPRLLTYAAFHGFMHQTDRTVHEQAYFRLSGKSRPARFHDVIPGGIADRPADEVRREIEKTAFALERIGIRPGDRVAVVGYNSSRYFVIDVAIGLVGAVSVPLYYSSPAGELMEIIEDSGARLLFVGVPEILEKLTAAGLRIPIISSCRAIPQCALPENCQDWQEFLAGSEAAHRKSPVRFEDTATLRYTSGTTGRPKGAVFDHANLRSMAESLASLPPWQARTAPITYLSFLPMNHVVEGILASYAIYYAPASIDIYYLEDFRELQNVLPEIRPTVFFSVPRFYEKVWESVSQSIIGRQFLRSRDGFRKRLLGRILCRAVKRKAGLDRCAQMIVGSAPVSAELLQNFRSIGIEVHNAYGLTEAPLITLNRHRANRIGTVGEPLPDTQIRIAEDGEILVKGPQVMRGYFSEWDHRTAMPGDAKAGDGNGNSSPIDDISPIEDGWLHTGDYGSLTDDNYLVLNGRKKEVIINSYGKNINPVKIELMLREATGTDHVMVIGDNRPYCIALFWGRPNSDRSATAEEVKTAVEERIRKINRKLSHPEQIKKWAFLPGSLSIEGGDLTANLKIKRAAVAEKHRDVIEAMYGRMEN